MRTGGVAARTTVRSLMAVALAVTGLTWMSEAPVGASSPSGGAAAATVTPPDMRMLVLRNEISIGNDGTTKLLHYSHVTSDLGPGPFEIVPHYDSATGVATFSQEIFNRPSAGHWRPDHRVPVAAIGVFHGPFDYQFPLNSFALLRAGKVVARSPKTDYCITGDYRVGGVPHTPPQTFIPASNCQDPTAPLGWSIGWGDQYDQTDSGQPIDITGLPDGTYTLRGIVDPEHLLTETSRTNDVTDTVLTIQGDQVTVGAQTHPNLPLPSVRITSPSRGARVHDTVRLSARASAKGSRVRSVQFLVDGVPVGKPDTTAPYAVRWHAGSVTPGRHYVSARATNAKGIMNTARSVAVTVQARLGGLLVDRSATAVGGTTVTQRGFSTPRAGDLLVALVGADGQGQHVTVHGGGLTWRLVRRANSQPGDAEVWSARAHSALRSVTVRATAARTGYDVWMNLVALRGASGIGRTRASSSSGAPPKVAFPASAAGSVGLAVGNDFDQAASRHVGSGQRLLGEELAATGDTFWSQATSRGATARGRTITLDDPSPTGDRTNLVGIEIRTRAPARADRAAPTVRIANPIARQTVSGTVPVAAFAGDDVAVSSVRFSVDGHRLGAPVTSAPYVRRWNTTATSPGRHVLTARAVDAAGHVATTHQVVHVLNPAPPMTCFVVQSDVSARGKGTVSTPRFHTAMGEEVLLALVSSDGPATPGAQSAVVHGAGLTWHLVGRANTQRGDAEVWTATTDRVLTRARVTSTPAIAGYDQHLTVVALEGVTRVGAVTSAGAASGAPHAGLAITGPSASLVFAVGTARGAVRPTLPTGQIFSGHWADRSAHASFWSQYTNQAMSPAGTTVTMRAVRPAARPWNFVAVEAVGEEE